jgi:pilus assembly protein TadC
MVVLGFAVGGIAALPFARWAQRMSIATRVPPLRTERLRRRRATRPALPWVVASAGRMVSAARVRRTERRREAAVRRELPVVVDLVAVALAAGCTPYLAIEHAGHYAPTRTALMLRDLLRSCALGQSLDDGLRELGRREPVLRTFTDALRTSVRLGSPAGPALARVSGEVRADLRRRAEARARTVPVRLCFPLVACVLPAFALLTVAPVVLGGLHP